MLALLALSVPSVFAAEDKSLAEKAAEEEPAQVVPIETGSTSSMAPLQGSTEMTEILLEDQSLWKAAKAAIDKEEFSTALLHLQKLGGELGEGYEPLRAECLYNEAGCHLMLKRMKAATDTYRKAFELFEKYDSSNPLKGQAWSHYSQLKLQNPQLDSGKPPLQGSVNSSSLQGAVDKQNIALMPQKAQIAIDPNALLEVKESNRNIPVLDVNDRTVLPVIVKECFSDMTCLETAEIGSNVTNADQRWMPLMVHGRAAAFGMDGSANPTFRAKVNGRSYVFDVILPDMAEGQRKVLLVTNAEKICAVDVDSFDTWLLRMQRAKDGRITTARWYKLTHKKTSAPVTSQAAGQKLNQPTLKRNW